MIQLQYFEFFIDDVQINKYAFSHFMIVFMHIYMIIHQFEVIMLLHRVSILLLELLFVALPKI